MKKLITKPKIPAGKPTLYKPTPAQTPNPVFVGQQKNPRKTTYRVVEAEYSPVPLQRPKRSLLASLGRGILKGAKFLVPAPKPKRKPRPQPSQPPALSPPKPTRPKRTTKKTIYDTCVQKYVPKRPKGKNIDPRYQFIPAHPTPKYIHSVLEKTLKQKKQKLENQSSFLFLSDNLEQEIHQIQQALIVSKRKQKAKAQTLSTRGCAKNTCGCSAPKVLVHVCMCQGQCRGKN